MTGRLRVITLLSGMISVDIDGLPSEKCALLDEDLSAVLEVLGLRPCGERIERPALIPEVDPPVESKARVR